MRVTISPEQHKFFQANSYLILESLLTTNEASSLRSSIKAIKLKSPGYPEENLFRSIPLIALLARKRGWGEITYELIHKKPLRINSDKFFDTLPMLSEPMEEDDCGLILDLSSCRGVFFKNDLPASKLYASEPHAYLLLILTDKHLPEEINPVIKR